MASAENAQRLLEVPARPVTKADYPMIELLRAIAALLVLVYHVIEVSDFRSFPNTDPFRTFRAGWIGVDLFLVISGYVIVRSAVLDYGRQRAGFRTRFMIRRVARLLPLYVFTSLIFLFFIQPEMLLRKPSALAFQAFTHLLFIHNWFVETHGSINGVTWTLALEMQFYLLICLLTPALMHRRAVWLVLAFFPVALAYRWGVFSLAGPGINPPMIQFVHTTQLPGTLDAFAVGMLIALGMELGAAQVRAMFIASVPVFLSWLTAGATLFATCMALFWPRQEFWSHLSMVTWWRLLLELSFGCLLAAAVTFPWPQLAVLRPLRYLGEVSYGIYLWHMMLIIKLDPLPRMGGYRLLRLTLLCTFLLAALSWHLIEKPVLERARKVQRLSPGALIRFLRGAAHESRSESTSGAAP
jgi:peptidoglycan/LPS O-acetylase OafA/YrhL